MSAGTVREARKISVLVVGRTPQLFSLFQSLETLGCQCFFAQSRQELVEILEQTKLDKDIVTRAH
jgi:anti-anti-sigma regulatory factor